MCKNKFTKGWDCLTAVLWDKLSDDDFVALFEPPNEICVHRMELALEVLGTVSDPTFYPRVVRIFEHHAMSIHSKLRRGVVFGCSNLRIAKTWPILKQLTKDSDESVREAAKEALEIWELYGEEEIQS